MSPNVVSLILPYAGLLVVQALQMGIRPLAKSIARAAVPEGVTIHDSSDEGPNISNFIVTASIHTYRQVTFFVSICLGALVLASDAIVSVDLSNHGELYLVLSALVLTIFALLAWFFVWSPRNQVGLSRREKNMGLVGLAVTVWNLVVTLLINLPAGP